MVYLISFLEGIITFISPCMLPMLPIYVSYFAGNGKDKNTFNTLKNALGFVLGFTFIFIALGAFAGTLGRFLQEYKTLLNIVTGLVVVLFGLNYMGILRFNVFGGMKRGLSGENSGFLSSVLFGIIFSVGWTPCVGAFLGSALMMASQQGSVFTGVVMLLVYSAGLGVPFVISAVLIDKLKGAFDFIKKNYRLINNVCGGLLVLVGILMMTGFMGKYLALIG